jgi:hypothetical protein
MLDMGIWCGNIDTVILGCDRLLCDLWIWFCASVFYVTCSISRTPGMRPRDCVYFIKYYVRFYAILCLCPSGRPPPDGVPIVADGAVLTTDQIESYIKPMDL